KFYLLFVNRMMRASYFLGKGIGGEDITDHIGNVCSGHPRLNARLWWLTMNSGGCSQTSSHGVEQRLGPGEEFDDILFRRWKGSNSYTDLLFADFARPRNSVVE